MITPVPRLGLPAIFSAVVFWFVSNWPASSVHAATLYWTGAGNGYMSDSRNWTPQRPVENGDHLVFGLGPDREPNDPQRTTFTNDFGSRRVSMEFHEYSFSVYPLFPNYEIVVETNSYPYFNLDVDYATVDIYCPLRFPSGGSFSVYDSDIRVHGRITVDSGLLLMSAGYHFIDEDETAHISVEDLAGDGDVLAQVDGADPNDSIDFIGGTDNANFFGSLYVSTYANTHINFNKSSGRVINSSIVVTNGDNARLFIRGSDQIGANTVVKVTEGSKLIFDGLANPTVGSLVLENVHADAQPSTVEMLGNLYVNNSISASVDNDHVHPTIIGNGLVLNQTMDFNVNGGPEPGLEIQSSLGPNGFNKTGSGRLVLNNHFQNSIANGFVTVMEGTLELDTTAALGFTGPVGGLRLMGGNLQLQEGLTISGVPLFVDASSQGNSFLTSAGQATWAGPVVLDSTLNVAAPVSFTPGVELNFSGVISGAGGLNLVSTFLGGGTVRLSGPQDNSFTGPLTVNCEALELDKEQNVHCFSGPLIIGGSDGDAVHEVRWLNHHQCDGAAITLFANGLANLNGFHENVGAVTFNGGKVDTGTGEIDIHQPLTVNASDTTAIMNGSLGLPPLADRIFNIAQGTADPALLVNASVSGGAPRLVKNGAGTMVLGNVNSYTGETVVNEGVLEIDTSMALGSTAAAVTVASTATLRVGDAAIIAKPLTIAGNGAVGSDGKPQGAVQLLNGYSLLWNTGPITLAADSLINVGTEAILGLNAAILGTGSLTKGGAGALALEGDDRNTYLGNTFVNLGTLELLKPGAIPNHLIIGNGDVNSFPTARQSSSSTIGGSVTVDRGGLWDLNGNTETFSIPQLQGQPPLTLKNGGAVQTGNGLLILPVGGDIIVTPGISGGSHIGGHLGLDPGPHHLVVGSHTVGSIHLPECTVTADISETSSSATLEKDGTGTLHLTGANTYTGSTILANGTLTVDGTQTQSPIQISDGTRLLGSGTVGPINFNGSSGVVQAGSGPGILSCGNFSANSTGNGTLTVQLNGPDPGIGYDQLNVHGTVNLSGVALNASLNFVPGDTNEFVLINNDAADPVVGTFNGLSQNSTLVLANERFIVSYSGGDGNDVVLRHVSPLDLLASTWTNVLGGDWSEPTNWNNHVVPNGSSAAITNNGPYTIVNNADVALTQFFYDNPNSTISGSGNFTLTGPFAWEAGSFAGSGTVTANGGMHISGGPAGPKFLTTKALLNTGTATWSDNGTIYFGGGAVLSNATNSTFDCAGDGTLENLPGTNMVINAGAFRKTGGTNTTRINVPFFNTGSVSVQSGTLLLNNGGTNTDTITVAPGATFILGGGTFTSSAGSTITGSGNLMTGSGANVTLAGLVDIAGAHVFNGGTVNLAGAYNCSDDLSISGSTVNFDGTGTVAPKSLSLSAFGTLGGANVVNVNGPLTWDTASTISGSNPIFANGQLTILPGTVFLSGRTLVNRTSAVWTNNAVGAIQLANGAVLANAQGATFDLIGSGEIQNSIGANGVINSGLMRKAGGANTTGTIFVTFTNDANVEVQSGVLSLAGGGEATGEFTVFDGARLELGGTHNFGPASSITGTGDFSVIGGTANMAGLVNATGTHTFSFGTANITGNYTCVGNDLNLTGGTAIFDGTGTIAPGSLTLNGLGNLGGSELVTVNGPMNWGGSSSISGGNNIVANGGMNISGNVLLGGRTLVNNGVAIWTNDVPASLTLSDGAVLLNAPGATFDCAFDGFLSNGPGTNTILNDGLFRKSGGTNTTVVSVPFYSMGVVEAQSGLLNFVGPFFVEEGGSVKLSGGQVTNTLPMQLLGLLHGNGLISGDVINQGMVSPGFSPGQLIMNNYTQLTNGALNIELGGTNAGVDFDQLIVSNTAALGGALNVTLINGFNPAPNSTFTVLSAGNIQGSFANLNYASAEVGLALNYTFTNVTVQVVNTRPAIAPIADQIITNNLPFELAVQATDRDLPPQNLTYRFLLAPTGMRIDTNGVVTWTPRFGSIPTTKVVAVLVTDDGIPSLTATQFFRVSIGGPGMSSVASVQVGIPGTHSNTVTFSGMPNSTYIAEYATNLTGQWNLLSTNIVPTNGVWSIIDPDATNDSRFYRAFWLFGP